MAVDNHEPHLTELRRRAAAEGVSDKIRTCLGDMRDFTMGEKVIDLIWSEGALFAGALVRYQVVPSRRQRRGYSWSPPNASSPRDF